VKRQSLGLFKSVTQQQEQEEEQQDK